MLLTEPNWFWGLWLVWSVGFFAFWAWRLTKEKAAKHHFVLLAVQFVLAVLIAVIGMSPELGE
jgi:thiol:disulfide interchange protein